MDPDQLASWKPADMDLHCFQNGICLGLACQVLYIFAAASQTLYYHIEPKFYVNFRQSEVFLNCNIHHTS